jgi:hypothetical protein
MFAYARLEPTSWDAVIPCPKALLELRSVYRTIEPRDTLVTRRNVSDGAAASGTGMNPNVRIFTMANSASATAPDEISELTRLGREIDAAVRLDQGESIELAFVALIIKGAKVTPIHLEAPTWRRLHSQKSAGRLHLWPPP